MYTWLKKVFFHIVKIIYFPSCLRATPLLPAGDKCKEQFLDMFLGQSIGIYNYRHTQQSFEQLNLYCYRKLKNKTKQEWLLFQPLKF